MEIKESGLYPETTKDIVTGVIKYTSKTKRNECKNKDCKEKRQNGSSRCLKCALNK